MRLAPNSMRGVLILVAIAIAQSLSYSHAPAMVTETSIGPEHIIGYYSTPSDDWPTYHRDTFRSGYDSVFPQFTSVSLHWKSTALDGEVYAEPLIVGTAVIVATEENSLYELSATTGQTLWHINLGTPVNGGILPCGDINPSGITGTPVIDVSGRTIFVVAFLQSPQLHHELFAIDLATGKIKFQLAIDPQGANPTVQQQRAALALANGYVYVAYGGLDGDCGQYHGWLAATNTNGGGPVLSYQVPTGRAGAIWGGGDGPVVDNSGDLLVATGNSDATSSFDFGDAVIKLSPATNPPISLVDWFAPSNWGQLNQQDLDLGSTEPVILSSSYLFQIGKEGIGYLLDATNLGKIGGQLYSSPVCNGGGAYGGLAYSSPYLVVPCDNGVVALKVNLGSNPPFTVVWRGPNFLAGPPMIAGNAVWDVDVSDGLIYALSLTSGQTLFHDAIGSLPTHFNSLSAGDGQIFVSASRQVLAYLPQQGSMQTLTTGVASGSGTISPDCSSGCSYGVGQSVTVTANPSSGWQFSSWSATGASCSGGSSSNPCTFTMPNNAVTVSATFTPLQVTMSVSYLIVGGGSPAAPSFIYVQNGAAKNLKLTTTATTVMVDSGSPWSVSPNPLGGSSLTTRWRSNQLLRGTASSGTIVFSYYHQYLTKISFSVRGGGSGYSPPTFQANQFGSIASVPLTNSASGYWFDAGSSWNVGPNPLTGSNPTEQWFTTQKTSGTITGGSTQLKLQHQFHLTMEVNPSGPGSTSPNSGWYNAGQKVTIKAIAKTGHKFLYWSGTGPGSYSGPSTSPTITMNSAITETANFT